MLWNFDYSYISITAKGYIFEFHFRLSIHRFSPEATFNEGPYWLKNLYFAYLIELRALAKAAPFLKHERYFTGNEEEDVEVRKAIDDLLNIVEWVLKFDSIFPADFSKHTVPKCIFVQIISVAFQRKSHVYRWQLWVAQNQSRIQREISKYFENNGLCRLRQVSAVGQITGAGIGYGTENSVSVQSRCGRAEKWWTGRQMANNVEAAPDGNRVVVQCVRTVSLCVTMLPILC